MSGRAGGAWIPPDPRPLVLLSQWHGSRTSTPHAFQMPGLPSLHFVVFGGKAGTVVIQGYEVLHGTDTADTDFGGSACSAAATAAAGALPSRLSTQLVINLKTGKGGKVEDSVGVVRWGGGPQQLLAAAVGYQVYVLALEPYFEAIFTAGASCAARSEAGAGGGAGAVVGASSTAGHRQLCVVRHRYPIVALDWTQTSDGLLSSDARGNIKMSRLEPVGGGLEQRLVRTAAAAAAAAEGADGGGRGGEGGDEGLESAFFLSAATIAFQVEELWAAQADGAQDVISAGFDVAAPAATTAAGRSRSVTVWWPRRSPDKQEVEVTADTAVAAATASIKLGYQQQVAAAKSAAAAGAPKEAAVRAEVLRHPCPVTTLQWSPGLLQQLSFEAAQGTVDDEDDMAGSSSGAYASPALLTVAADGAMRLWVEVSLMPALPPPFAPGGVLSQQQKHDAVPQQPMMQMESHFCVTLVVELPLKLRPRPGGALHACWGMPLGCVLRTAHWSSMVSKVLWLVAVVDQPDGSSDVCCWAVEQLAAISGVPTNMQQQRRPPRAVLWGTTRKPARASRALAAEQGVPHQPPQQQAAHLPCTTCYANFEGEVPLLSLYDCPPSGIGEPAAESHAVDYCRLCTVEEGVSSPMAAAQHANHISLQEHSRFATMHHAARLVALAPHPRRDLAITVDRDGVAMLWDTSPIAPLALISSSSPSSPPSSLLHSQGAAAAATTAASMGGLSPLRGGHTLLGSGRGSGDVNKPSTACWLAGPAHNWFQDGGGGLGLEPTSPDGGGSGAGNEVGGSNRQQQAAELVLVAGCYGIEVIALEQRHSLVQGASPPLRWHVIPLQERCPMPAQTVEVVKLMHLSAPHGSSKEHMVLGWLKRASTTPPLDPLDSMGQPRHNDCIALWAVPTTTAAGLGSEVAGRAAGVGVASPVAGGGSNSSGGSGSSISGSPRLVATIDLALQLPDLGGEVTCCELIGGNSCLALGTSSGHLMVLSVTTAPHGILNTMAQLPCGVDSPGRPVALAASPCGSYLAAVVLGAGFDGMDVLMVWQCETSGCSGVAYQLEACVELMDTPTSVSWIDPGLVAKCVAVGCSGKGVLVYAPDAGGGDGCTGGGIDSGGGLFGCWREVAHFSGTNNGVWALHVQRRASILAAVDEHPLQVSLQFEGGLHDDEEDAEDHGVLQEVLHSTVVPVYHPQSLAMMLSRGRADSVAHLVRSVLQQLQGGSTDGGSTDSGQGQGGGRISPMQLPGLLPFPRVNAGDLVDSAALQEVQQLLKKLCRTPPHASVAAPSHQQQQMAGSNSFGSEGASQQITSGVLEMSSFGMGRGSGMGAVLGAAAGSGLASADGVTTGMVDLSAFGMGSGATGVQVFSPAPDAQMASGMLDLSAFGMDNVGAAAEEPQPPQPPAPDAQMASGMLDLSAFGMGNVGAAAEEPQRPQPPAADAQLASGMLDLSAFGVGGLGAAAEELQPPQAPAADAELSSRTVDLSALGIEAASQPPSPEAKHELEPAPAAPPSSMFGGFDMSAFGFGGGAAADPPDPPTPPAEPARPPTSASPSFKKPPLSPSVTRQQQLQEEEDAEEEARRKAAMAKVQAATAICDPKVDPPSAGSSSGGGRAMVMLPVSTRRRQRQPLLTSVDLIALRAALGCGQQGINEEEEDPSPYSYNWVEEERQQQQRGGAGGGFSEDGDQVHIAPLPGLSVDDTLAFLRMAELAQQQGAGASGLPSLPSAFSSPALSGSGFGIGISSSSSGGGSGGCTGGLAGALDEAGERALYLVRLAAAFSETVEKTRRSQMQPTGLSAASLGPPKSPSSSSSRAAAVGTPPGSRPSSRGSGSGSRKRLAVGGGSSRRAPWTPRMSPSVANLSTVSVMSFDSLQHMPARAVNPAGVEMPVMDSHDSSNAAAAAAGIPGSWSASAGMLPGLGMDSSAWALLSGCKDELLEQACAALPPAAAGSDAVAASSTTTGVIWSRGDAPRPVGGGTAPPGMLSWHALRSIGAGFWVTDLAALRKLAEVAAKTQFVCRKDPHDCALLYVALGNRLILQGLFRTAGNARLSDFLRRDFSEERHRHAARKNAFVLLGQHRYDLAAAFFVLGDALQDAVGVCLHNLGDPQLALVLCRLVDGQGGQVERDTMQKELMPRAMQAGDPWAVAVLHWLLGDLPGAMHALLPPPEPARAVPLATGLSPARGAPLPPSQHLAGAARRASGTNGSGSSIGNNNGEGQASGVHPPVLPNSAAIFALDYVLFCLLDPAIPVSLSGAGSSYLWAVDRLAAMAAHGLSSHGLPLQALEALQVAFETGPHAGIRSSSGGSSGGPHPLVRRLRRGLLSRTALQAALSCLPPGAVAEAVPASGVAVLQQQQYASPSSVDEKEVHAQVAAQLRSLQRAGLPLDLPCALTIARELQALCHPALSPSISLPTTCLATPSGSGLLPHIPSQLSMGQLFTRIFRQRHQHLMGNQHHGGAQQQRGAGARAGTTQGEADQGGQAHAWPLTQLGDPFTLINIEGDSIYGLCCSSASAAVAAASARGGGGAPLAAGPALVVATSTHGLVEGEVHQPGEDLAGSEVSSEGSTRSGAFASLLYSMFETSRWQSASSSAAGNGGGARDAFNDFASLHSADFPDYLDSDAGPGIGVHGGLGHQQHGSDSPRGISSEDVVTGTLDAHPTRSLYLSGHTSGEVLLWPFNSKHPMATFAPATRPPGGNDAALLAPLDDNSPAAWFRSFSMGSAAAKPGLPVTWAYPMAARFSASGDRFAGIGDGGLVATWSLDAPRASRVHCWADWTAQALARKGCDVAYVAGSSSVLAAGGSGSGGANIAIWDTLAPPTSGCVARLNHHSSTVTRLAALPGGILLASADESGSVAVKDLRMLGATGQAARPLWQAQASSTKAPCTAMTCARDPQCPDRTLLITGSKDGSIALWDVDSGVRLQHARAAHVLLRRAGSKGGGLSDSLAALRVGGGGSGAGVAVTGLKVIDKGLLSCGLDGTVKYHPLEAAAAGPPLSAVAVPAVAAAAGGAGGASSAPSAAPASSHYQ